MSARSALVLHWCGDCRGVQAFEVPQCDEHVECPELACIECGTAVLVGALHDADLAFAVGGGRDSDTDIGNGNGNGIRHANSIAPAPGAGRDSGVAAPSRGRDSAWTMPRSA